MQGDNGELANDQVSPHKVVNTEHGWKYSISPMSKEYKKHVRFNNLAI